MSLGVIIVSVLVLLYVIYMHHKYERDEHFKKIQPFKGEFTTGDVIMLNGDSMFTWYNFTWHWFMGIIPYLITKHFATHCGVVIIYDKPYIYQMVGFPTWDDYRKKYVYNGPVYQDLYKFINEYPGFITIYKTPKPIKPILNEYEYSLRPFHRIVDFMFSENVFSSKNALYCYEHLCDVLQIPNYRSILPDRLYKELYKRHYTGPFLYKNIYHYYRHLF